MMKIAVCDDNDLIRTQVGELVIRFCLDKQINIPEIAYYESGEKMISDRCEWDIVYIDIRLPGMDGIDVGKELKKRNNKVIMIF